MNKKIIKNYIYSSLYQIVVAITPILTIPYKAKIFTPESLGIYSYVFNVISYIILLGSIGIDLYGKREIAYHKDNITERTKVLYELIIIKTIMLISTTIIFYLTIARFSEYKMYYFIMMIEIVANIYNLTWYFEGIEEFKRISIINIITRIINVAAIFIFLKTNNDLIKYMIITITFDVVPVIILIISIKKYIKKIKLKDLKIKRHIKMCLILFIPQICINIYTACDKIILGTLGKNMSEVCFYEYSDKIIQIILKIINSISIVMLPVVSELFKNGDKEKIKECVNKAINYAIFISIPMTFGIIVTSHNITTIIFKEEYIKISVLLKILALQLLPVGITTIIGGQYLVATKQEKKFTVYILIGTIINLLLNINLITKYKSIGVAFSTVITEIIILIIEMPIIKQLANIKELKKNVIKYTVYSVIMSIIVYCIGKINCSIVILIIQIFTGIIIYIMILKIRKDKIYKELKEKT